MNEKNKILMILDNAFSPDLRVEKEISSLLQLGFKVDLICWNQDTDLSEYEDKGDVKVHRIKLHVDKQIGIKKILFLYKFFVLLKGYVKRKNINFDYLYVHDFLMLPIGVYFKKKYSTLLIYDAHEIYHLMEWEKYPNFISKIIYYIERKLINYVDHFIVVSEQRKNFYKEKLNKNINIIGNWYNDYKGESTNIKTELNIEKSKIVLAYFGVVNFKVRPINQIFDYVSNSEYLHLVVGGIGVDDKNIYDLISKKKNITYLGWVENVRKYLDSIDYLIYFMNSNRFYANYTAPNSIYLAISHLKPLITNVGGEPLELINNKNIGIHLENISDFEEIDFENKEKYIELINNIKNIKNKYKWDNASKIYEKILS